MSSHTDEETYTVAQMREAFEKSGRCMETLYDFDLMVEELPKRKPMIHPNMPVMYDEHPHGETRTCLDRYRNALGDNIRALIPEEMVMVTAVESWNCSPRNYVDYLEWWKDKITDFKTNGPGDSHE